MPNSSQPVTLDLDRQRRCGFPEVVFGDGKSVETLEGIFQSLQSNDTSVFATRVTSEKAEQLLVRFPGGKYNPVARTFRVPGSPTASAPTARIGRVAVVSAGTSDLPVAEEARDVDCPVIAVPTSVGYGANFGGIAALLSMLNSCAANVTVVNIDAGFKGGYIAGMIATASQRRASSSPATPSSKTD
jgi:NCAIR mutase (PurE)-related protein